MAPVMSCRWDWCRSTFPTIDALDTHVRRDHIWPMKPMRKAEIALMRRMDLQSLHSSLDTDSSIISRGFPSRSKQTPLAAPPRETPENDLRPENEELDTFSPSFPDSPHRSPVSPASESMTKHDGHSGLSAAIQKFERNKRSHQRLPTRIPRSPSSGSSQEVIERELTQEDDMVSQPLRPPESQNDNDLTDFELVWPTDDESSQEIRDSGQPVAKQDHHPSGSPDLVRGQTFRCGSLSVPLSVKAGSPNPQAPDADSKESLTPSQPFVLQTQAPYSSQALSWSQ